VFVCLSLFDNFPPNFTPLIQLCSCLWQWPLQTQSQFFLNSNTHKHLYTYRVCVSISTFSFNTRLKLAPNLHVCRLNTVTCVVSLNFHKSNTIYAMTLIQTFFLLLLPLLYMNKGLSKQFLN